MKQNLITTVWPVDFTIFKKILFMAGFLKFGPTLHQTSCPDLPGPVAELTA